jgi:hypothetical protein
MPSGPLISCPKTKRTSERSMAVEPTGAHIRGSARPDNSPRHVPQIVEHPATAATGPWNRRPPVLASVQGRPPHPVSA